MPRIIEVIGVENKKEYAVVHVLLSDGEEAQVYVGGDVEVYLAHGKIKAFVKRSADASKKSKNEYKLL